LPKEVVAAWEKAGARAGWSGVDENGFLRFHTADEPPRVGWVPAFTLWDGKVVTLKDLPAPATGFALYLDSANATDAQLKELGRFQQLTSLDLLMAKVTASGLKELAPLKNLTALELDFAHVTDEGAKILAGFGQLRVLELAGSEITNAGLKDLANLKQLRTLSLFGARITAASNSL
jgi:hypothetical protein